MKIRRIISAMAIGWCVLAVSAAFAEVEVKTYKQYKLTEPPVDIAVSRGGKWVYVLTKKGTIRVFTLDGDLKDEVQVGTGVNRIAPGTQDEMLFLSNSRDDTVQMVFFEFVHDINVSGSPFKGSADAPVTVAVFSDFE